MTTRFRLTTVFATALIVARLTIPLTAGTTAQPEVTEAEVKAAFLFNFIRFVDWPQTAFSDSRSPIVIGVLGDSSIEGFIKSIASGKTINGRRVTVRGGHDLATIGKAHLLFFSANENKRTTQMVESLKGVPVLIVGEVSQFAQQGGMVNFFIEDDTVRFEMNPDAAQRAGLNIRSQLLFLARIVRDK